MNGFLRQSTASQARLIGPFLDDTDFKSAETGLTIANTDITVRANGTTLSTKNSGGGTHQVNGMYSVSWDATDTANVGELFYSVKVAGALQVFGSYVVVEEAVYDALYAASAPGFATVASIAALNNLSAAQVNAEVLDVLNVDTFAEPAQGAPAATTTIVNRLGFLYKAWRNRHTQTATEYALYNDDATTKGHEAVVSSDGTTTERGEVGTGA
ncbi:MAG TPA: hypothetical protein VJ816_04795 [Gemmatimonadales bacterium]|nr:hypothetical protein [Gemmatimonadales bacterium]